MSVRVALPGGTGYEAHVVPRLQAADPARVVPGALAGVPTVLLSDQQVDELHGERAAAWLDAAGLRVLGRHTVVVGEQAKTLRVAQEVLETFCEFELERGGLVVSLGGGVVGDLAGFAASIHRRGVSVAHLPTSLLAQVDSCLGGKTAINLPSGRNLAGTFHQPRFVLAAVDLLETLPPRHFRSGLAEAIKCGMLADRPLLDWIGGRRPRRAGDLGAEERVELVTRCLEIKARVVMEDERETGLRRVLNLGHTLGHALESVTGYSEALYHGEAVAIGMVVAARLSEQRGLSPGGTAARLQRLLDLCGLPDSVPIGVEVEALLAAMRQDKKRLQGHAVWVLPRGLGQVTVVEGVTEEEIRTALAV